MKKIIPFLLLLIIAGCNQLPTYTPNMIGAYSLTSQIVNNGGIDSAVYRKQMKIFTDKYVMFASNTVADSSAGYGIGTYETSKGKITEYMFYTSGSAGHKDTFQLKVDTTVTGYKQIIDRITMSGAPYKLTEDYRRLGAPAASPLDGAWKQVKNIYIHKAGDSSVNNNPVEFKVYQNGYFIWGITTKDPSGNNASAFGYGTFSMDGNNRSIETVRNSNFTKGLVGRTYALDIQFSGPDKYTQTITFANDDRSTEFYERLK